MYTPQAHILNHHPTVSVCEGPQVSLISQHVQASLEAFPGVLDEGKATQPTGVIEETGNFVQDCLTETQNDCEGVQILENSALVLVDFF